MGYKLAGYTVLGNCEIDPKIAAVYKANLHPKYSFVMDVREFLKLPDKEIPAELFSLDVLDGSPPCSTFSMAGQREDAWNKEKKFAEGQKLQRLDDLFFTFIDIAKRLKPKVVIAENVKGLIIGNARGYVHEIVQGFNDAGYETQLFLLNAARMGVPQKRERTFFIARRKDLNFPTLRLSFNETPIMFGEVRETHGKPFSKKGTKTEYILKHRTRTDRNVSCICKRLKIKESGYARLIQHDHKPASTIIAGGSLYRGYDGLLMTDIDMCNSSSFPQDYKFTGKSVQFVCGMSVPPVMMANIAAKVAEQCFGVKYDEVANG